MAKLELSNVNKTYFGGYVGVENVNFSLSSGEVLTVFARKGGGKSTLLKLIATLESPSSGSIKIDGKDISTIPMEELNIAFATYELPLFKGRSVYYNLEYPLKLRKRDNELIKERIAKVSHLFDLDNILDEGVKYLSKSLRARVILARAFMREADFYLFDNILEDFTISERDEALALLSTIKERVRGGIIYATDRLDEVTLMGGDNCLVLSHGRMVDIGDISDIYSSPSELDSIRLVSDDMVSEHVRRVNHDKNGHFITLFGRQDIDIDKVYEGKDIVAVLRPEDVVLDKISGQNATNNSDNMGIVTHIYRKIDGDIVIASIGQEEVIALSPTKAFKVGDYVRINANLSLIFDIKAERRIIGRNKING